jgi:hypothetical protein
MYLKHFLFILSVFLASPIVAQITLDDYAMSQEIYKMEKREIYEEFIGNQVNNDFWKLYNEYEGKRIALEMNRFELVKNYAQDFFEMTDQQAANHLKIAEKLNIEFNKLITLYSNKFIKTNGGKLAMQFYQLELYFLASSRIELIENITTIAELLRED